MKTRVKAVLIMFLLLLFGAFACAQKKSLDEMDRKIGIICQQKRYSKAAKAAKEALAVTKEIFGSDHPQVAKSLTNIAGIYNMQGKLVEAEPLYKRALKTREKAFKSNYPEVAEELEKMAKLYKEMGKGDEAKRFEERARKIRLKTTLET